MMNYPGSHFLEQIWGKNEEKGEDFWNKRVQDYESLEGRQDKPLKGCEVLTKVWQKADLRRAFEGESRARGTKGSKSWIPGRGFNQRAGKSSPPTILTVHYCHQRRKCRAQYTLLQIYVASRSPLFIHIIAFPHFTVSLISPLLLQHHPPPL